MYRHFGLLITLILLLAVGISPAKAELSDGLLVWHDFEDLLDDSGNGHDADLSGDAYIADGLLYLDGTEDYADIGTPAGFGPVNPLVDALSDFTIAVAYACTSSAGGEGAPILVSVGPADASGSGDLSLCANSDGQLIDHWWVGAYGSDQSGLGYADGTVHLAIVTYEEATDTYTFYHLDGGAAFDHGSGGSLDWSGEWDETSDYGIRLGGHRNATIRANEGLDFLPDLDGQIDMFAIWNRALDTSEMPEIAEHTPVSAEKARNPNPGNKAEDVCPNVVLSWTPGVFADKHHVYFGTNFEDVNEANQADPRDVYMGSQDEEYYPLAGTLQLERGVTYYWRIDEVNAPPDPTIFKGDVWQFTIEGVGVAIAGDDIIATASSYGEGKEPENTVNGSGLDDDDLHSTVGIDMWLSAKDGPQPTWIQYEFDKVYKLHEMLVWNHNTEFEDLLGFGLKGVTVEYSTNGTDWTELAGVPEFAQASGKDDYAHNTTVNFGGVRAKYVKLTANSNWGGTDQYGLSEVRFLYIPVWPGDRSPQDGAEDVPIDVTLDWREGRETATNQVYLGTDEQAVTGSAVPPVPIAAGGCVSSYGPLSLDLDTTYYWKIAEVNDVEDPNVWESDVWSFTTIDSLIVDDMESYGDGAVVGEPGSKIWYTWKDGEGWTDAEPTYLGNASGSLVELGTDPAFGSRSLMYNYSSNGTNSLGKGGKNFYSEATAAISDLPMIDQDWTKGGAKALSLQFYGDPDNAAGATEQMYVKLNGTKIVYDGDMADIKEPWWHEWLIDLTDFAINLANVTQISIGFGNEGSGTPGGSGTVHFDEIRLYPAQCVAKYGPAGDITNDCFVGVEDFVVLANAWHMPYLAVEYTFDTDLSDTSGNGRHGIDVNSPSVHDGMLTLNGTNFVDIPFGADNPFDGSQDFSIAMDFKTTTPSILISSARDDEPDHHSMAVYIHHWDEPFWGEVVYDNFYVTASTAEDDPFDGEWHTMVVTYEADDEWFTVYLDGVPGEGTEMNPEIPNIADDTVRIGGSLNTEFPYRNDAGNFSDDIDNVRIYNLALSQEDVFNVSGVLFGPADLNKDGAVDFRDYKIVANTWLEEKLWP
ncbi:MAG: discoidin domain-containing protein [Planctomycetes bacterium]|nr:discoidin domain-containing protein [Planctomycetota bacterium]